MFNWLKPFWDWRGKSGDDWPADDTEDTDDTEFPTSGLENLEPGEPRVPSDPDLFPRPEPSLSSEFSKIPTFRHLPASKEPTEQKKAVIRAAWERSAVRKRHLGKPVPPPPVFEERWHIEAPGPPGDDVFPTSPAGPVPIATRSGAPGGSPFPEMPGLPAPAVPAVEAAMEVRKAREAREARTVSKEVLRRTEPEEPDVSPAVLEEVQRRAYPSGADVPPSVLEEVQRRAYPSEPDVPPSVLEEMQRRAYPSRPASQESQAPGASPAWPFPESGGGRAGSGEANQELARGVEQNTELLKKAITLLESIKSELPKVGGLK